jgi:hypothetical protein
VKIHELKKVWAAFAFICVANGCFALEFRNTSWLMTGVDVIASETSRAVSEASYSNQRQIVFRSVVNGYTATITYLLEDDKLLSASYTFTKDLSSRAFEAMKKDLLVKNGVPSVQTDTLLAWRLAKTEIALTHLTDGTTQAGYWEKSYFARINNLDTPQSSPNK